jgi:hypothetical protein
MMASSTLAQNVTGEESQPASKEAVVAEKEKELERKKAEIAAKVAQKQAVIAAEVQKQVELVQKQVELVQKQVELQIPKIENVAISRLSIPVWQHSGGGAVLVIPAAEMKVEDLATITEDMTVMSRIFDTKLSQAYLTTGRGIGSIGFDSLLFGRSSGAIEAIYLEGYGALFLMKVNILLSSPPEAQEEKKTEEEDTDPLWTQMRQEMYAPQDTRRRRTDRPEEKYDAEKVADLKETLIKTLKHAANIRTLKPDESVILTVIGKGSQSVTTVTRVYSRGDSRYITTTPGGARTGFSSPAVLTIRAKKADIDAFANGTLSFDQFSQKTQLFSYSYLGENISAEPSRSSFNLLGRSGRRSGSRGSSSPR